MAGLTIGLMLIPQSFAYAELAGLDPYLGLYAAFIGVAVYTVLGSAYIVGFGSFEVKFVQ